MFLLNHHKTMSILEKYKPFENPSLTTMLTIIIHCLLPIYYNLKLYKLCIFNTIKVCILTSDENFFNLVFTK